MTAREMFEEVGYEIDNSRRHLLMFRKRRHTTITFNLLEKQYYCIFMDEAMDVSTKMHKVITKQLEELGWLDE